MEAGAIAGTEPFDHQMTREEIFVALEGAAKATLDGVTQLVAAGDTVCRPGSTSRWSPPGTSRPAIVCLPVGGQGCLAGGAPFHSAWAE